MNVTSIEWTATVLPDGTVEPGFSANPIKYRDADGKIVWACVKVSPGCKACYAEALAKRYGRGGPYTRQTLETLTPYVCEKELKSLIVSKKLSGKKVFIGDMTDCFGEWVTDGMLDRIFAAFAIRRDVTWQVLTKRAHRMAAYLADENLYQRLAVNRRDLPLKNVWCGFSAENQEWFDRRTTHMAEVMRKGWTVFVSAEPLIGPILMTGWDGTVQRNWLDKPGISWVIVGGESGPGARPCELDWLRSIQNQCDAADVRFFCKQLGSAPFDWDRGDPPNFEPPALVRLNLRDKKGGDWSEWPPCLRCREFPEPARAA